eukprot:CAMPEP_0167746730 /NCGR_PEP_ID=MMETSP0110_2-20121227/3879_1 /TAXON_ID=629695 /ORGANISM="Gymnochlora sp., Strain CCMP2014" /LENGTH=115 /DNA_ID=CAMNT_0007631535 /DNA_START=140 /DNA_END=484 /DNA_ORIENTATION=+
MKRFISMAFCCIVSPICVIVYIYYYSGGKANVLTWLGISTEGLISALIFPLGLTATLFCGPLVDYALNNRGEAFESLEGLMEFDLKMIRNFIVAPFAEELVFRTCILSLLVFGGW